jgi:hypothetical protein
MQTARYEDAEGSFSFGLPDGWESASDEDGGLSIARDGGAGLLHLIAFRRELAEELDPAEELYAFLANQDIEVEEEEIEDLELPAGGLLATCEYAAEEADEAVYWLVAVAAAPGQLVFASYSCPIGEEDAEADQVLEILKSVVFDVKEEG